MKVVLITQKDPFFLGKNIQYLLKKLSKEISVEACILFEVSPFGKNESFIKKIKKTWTIFGPAFFFHYTVHWLRNKFDKSTEVRKILEEHKIPIMELEKSINHEDSLRTISYYNPEVLISIAGNQIFRKPLLELAPKGCINLHTALLPKYRGLMPSFWVLKNNEEYTGVSVFFVDEGIDSGPIIVQKKIKIGNMTQSELIRHSKKIGMDAIIEAIEKIHKNEVVLMDNNDEQMTYYSFPTREDVKEFRKIGKRFF